MKADRFPIGQSVLPAKRYEIFRAFGNKPIAEVTADTSRAALEAARAKWPEARCAVLKASQ